MNHYTNAEIDDKYFIYYGLVDGNSIEARRFPDLPKYSSTSSKEVHGKIHGGPGRLITIRTVEVEANVLNMIQEDPGSSTRKITNNALSECVL